jgi:hypothetical protein
VSNIESYPTFQQRLQLLCSGNVMVGHFWQHYVGQAVGGGLDLMVLIGGAEEQAAIQQDSFCSTNQHHQIELSTYCLSYIRLPKMPNYYIFTLTMATAVFAKMDNFQHLMQPSLSLKAEVVHCTPAAKT